MWQARSRASASLRQSLPRWSQKRGPHPGCRGAQYGTGRLTNEPITGHYVIELSFAYLFIYRSNQGDPMGISLPSLREQGVQALRDGDLDRAIEVFTRALI